MKVETLSEDPKRPTAPASRELTLLRLPQVLALFPIGRSTWWAGVRSGRFPKPVKLGPRVTAWRAADIHALLERLGP